MAVALRGLAEASRYNDRETLIDEPDLEDATRIALGKIKEFGEALRVARDTGNHSFRSGRYSITTRFACTGLVLAAISTVFTSIVVPSVLSSKYECLTRFGCFEGKTVLALSDIVRKFIGANQDQPWAKALIDSLGFTQAPFTDLKLFAESLKIFCAKKTALGLSPLEFDMHLHVPRHIKSGIPAAAFGYGIAGNLVLGLIGTALIETLGWQTPPLSLSQLPSLLRHLSTLKEYRQVERIGGDEEDPEIEEISQKEVGEAIAEGERVLWKQGGAYVQNLTYLSLYAAMVVGFYYLVQTAMQVPEEMTGDYGFNTFDRFHKQPDSCVPNSPLNMTYFNEGDEEYYPIPGGIASLHNATASYPNEQHYRSDENDFLAAILTGLAAPAFALTGRAISGIKTACVAASHFLCKDKRDAFETIAGSGEETREEVDDVADTDIES